MKLNETQNLTERFEIFLQKLSERAKELAREASSGAQAAYDEDTDHYKRSYLNFKSGIESQFRGIIDKAREVYETQIAPKRKLPFGLSLGSHFSPIVRLMDKTIERYHHWEAEINSLSDSVFASVREKNLEDTYREIMDDYHAVKENFLCTQCGGKLEIDQPYFVSTYISCPYCRTQNTFNPSNKMRELEHISRKLAEQRAKPFEDDFNRIQQSKSAGIDNIIAAFVRYRAAVWCELLGIVPALAEENKGVFFADIERFLQFDAASDIYYPPARYHNLLMRLNPAEEYLAAMNGCMLSNAPDYDRAADIRLRWQQIQQLYLALLRQWGDNNGEYTNYYTATERLLQGMLHRVIIPYEGVISAYAAGDETHAQTLREAINAEMDALRKEHNQTSGRHGAPSNE